MMIPAIAKNIMPDASEDSGLRSRGMAAAKTNPEPIIKTTVLIKAPGSEKRRYP